ncbi:MAG TPA: GatB/YqeY domain-containing protein [Candidatus Aquicultor sp.]|jgi:hypothetical protein
MPIKDQLNEDMKSAMRAAAGNPDEKIRLGTIRFLNAELKNAEITKKEPLSDEEILEVIQRQIKRRRESIEQYRKGGRNDLADKEEKESAVLAGYLPEQLSDDELRTIIKGAVEQTGASTKREMGKVMAIVMPQVKGKADGRRVNEVASEFLSG